MDPGEKKVYLDTSVLSALFDTYNPERQSLTEEFFLILDQFQVFISEVTKDEISRTPNFELREKMLNAIHPMQILTLTQSAETLAIQYVKNGAIPPAYLVDAFHIAIAVLNDIDYLLSWNFKHVVKNKTRDIVQTINAKNKYRQIAIITPAELLE